MIGCIDIIIGTLIIVYVISIIIISGTTLDFSVYIIAIGAILILYHFIKNSLADKRYFIIIKKYFSAIACIGLLFYATALSILIGCPKINKENTEYILILGTELKDDGNVSKILRDRLNVAVRSIYTDGNNGYIVVSGGKGKDEIVSEAMESYLKDQGIPKDRIIKEKKSRTTLENIKFSKEIIEQHSGKKVQNVSVKIVTTDFEAFRINKLAKKNGYQDVKLNTAKTNFYLAPAYYTREVFAVIKSIIYN